MLYKSSLIKCWENSSILLGQHSRDVLENQLHSRCPWGSVGQPAHTAGVYSEAERVKSSNITEKQQQNSNRRGKYTQAIINVNGVGRLMKLGSFMTVFQPNPTEMSS